MQLKQKDVEKYCDSSSEVGPGDETMNKLSETSSVFDAFGTVSFPYSIPGAGVGSCICSLSVGVCIGYAICTHGDQR